MADFWLVLGISLLAAGLTWLGAPLAERYDVPQRVVGGALQFAAGVIMGLVVATLMPPAVRGSSPTAVTLAFFLGGALFVLFDYQTSRRAAAQAAANPAAASQVSLTLYVGILIDLVVDGVVIGIGSTLSVATGLLLALGMAVSTMPLAFVTIATAKLQGVSPSTRRTLALLFVACLVGGALFGFLLLQHQPLWVRLALVALASGFLITTVTQTMIPEANRDGEPTYAGIYFVVGLSLYSLVSLLTK